MLVVLESTTYPGTTEEVILPTLTKTGLRVGQDFFVVFSPERGEDCVRKDHERSELGKNGTGPSR